MTIFHNTVACMDALTGLRRREREKEKKQKIERKMLNTECRMPNINVTTAIISYMFKHVIQFGADIQPKCTGNELEKYPPKRKYQKCRKIICQRRIYTQPDKMFRSPAPESNERNEMQPNEKLRFDYIFFFSFTRSLKVLVRASNHIASYALLIWLYFELLLDLAFCIPKIPKEIVDCNIITTIKCNSKCSFELVWRYHLTSINIIYSRKGNAFKVCIFVLFGIFLTFWQFCTYFVEFLNSCE